MAVTNITGEYSGLSEKKFAILQEISNYVVSTENITSIANLMLDLAIKYTNAEKGSLMLVNEMGELKIHQQLRLLILPDHD